jgi:hypothetical protein
VPGSGAGAASWSSRSRPAGEESLTQHAIEEQFPAYVARLRQEAGVEILDEKFKPQDPVSESFSLPAK